MNTNPILNMGGETINALTADASPVGSTDFVMTYDASAAALKKVLLDNLPGGGGISDLEGTPSFALWTTGETTQFDFFVWHSNSNNNGKDIGNLILNEAFLYYIPIYIGKQVNIFRTGIRVSVAGGVFLLGMGIYSNRTDGQNYPATLLASSSQNHTGAGFKTVLQGSQTLPPGLYWMALVFSSNDITRLFFCRLERRWK